MFKFVAVGLWVCIVAFGALFLGVQMNTSSPESQESDPAKQVRINHERAAQMSVPTMIGGRIAGYIVVQLSYTLDADVKARISVPLSLFVNDEIFRALFNSYSTVAEIERIKFEDVKKQIIDGVNQRFPEPVIKDILVEQFTFLSIEQVRKMRHERAIQ